MSTPSIIKTPTIIEQNVITEENGVKSRVKTIYLDMPLTETMSIRLKIATSGSLEYWRERFDKFMSDTTVKDKTIENSRIIVLQFFDSIMFSKMQDSKYI